MNKLMIIAVLSASTFAGACADEASSSVTRIDADRLRGVSLLELELVDGDRYEFDTSRGPLDWDRIAFVDGGGRADATVLGAAAANLGGRFEVQAEIADDGWTLRSKSIVPEGAIGRSRCIEWSSITTAIYDSHGNYLWSITSWFCSAST